MNFQIKAYILRHDSFENFKFFLYPYCVTPGSGNRSAIQFSRGSRSKPKIGEIVDIIGQIVQRRQDRKSNEHYHEGKQEHS